jgi:hypothetical protein
VLFHRGVHHHQAVMIGGEAAHRPRVRVGRAEVAQDLGRVASQMAHLLLMTIGVMEDGVMMTMIGVHLAVNQVRADQALANLARAVALHLMTIGVMVDGVTTTIGVHLVENLARVVAARVNLERVARLVPQMTIGILHALKDHGNTMNG